MSEGCAPGSFKSIKHVVGRTITGYVVDVLLRVQTHPNARIGELLPHERKRLRSADNS
ncbi:hypothetical protein [Corallococcus sp. CA047B]|uniref:hypothetical protein n=1 Tax=Corallococcus sp. CA047B TaxID=2316729 RepID=UPI00131547C2|nr:hypothetical protein [Corallococcus sp. CA047B]